MIVVVADDFSGAAEVASAAWTLGLRAEVQTKFDPASSADVLCVDTNTRVLDAAAATRVVSEVGQHIAAIQPALIYKKTDSVLRGNVVAEIDALLQVTKLRRAVLVSANPSRGRIVRDGRCFIHNTPLDQTPFAHDPRHPRRSANVRDLLSDNGGGSATESPIETPDATSGDDLHAIARRIDADTLAAGAVEFFEALVAETGVGIRSANESHDVQPMPTQRTVVPESTLIAPWLLVCGSAASWGARVQLAQSQQIPLFAMPHDELAIIRSLHARRAAIVGIGPNVPPLATPEQLEIELAQLVRRVVAQAPCATLALEGGSTALAIVKTLGWERFETLSPFGNGAAALRAISTSGASSPLLAVKPGSYDWPMPIRIPAQ